MDASEKEILEWYKTSSFMEKAIFYRSAHKLVEDYKELEADNAALKKRVERLWEALYGEYCDCELKDSSIIPSTHETSCNYRIVRKRIEARKDEQRDCDNCATTGLLCPIRNNDPPFSFPCPHWVALEAGEANDN